MQFTMEADAPTFYAVLREEGEKLNNPMDLVYPNEVPLFDKYDEYLPEELVKKGFAYGVLRMDEVKDFCRSLSAEKASRRNWLTGHHHEK